MSEFESNDELQVIVLSGLCSTPNLMGVVYEDLSPAFFSNPGYQYVYKVLYKYYVQYNKIPTQLELVAEVRTNYNSVYGDLNEIVQSVNEVYNIPVPDFNFVKASVETFVKRSKFSDIIQNFMTKFRTDKTVTLDEVMDDIVDTYNYQIIESDCIRLDNYQAYMKKRIETLGTDSTPKVIKSFVKTINSCATYNGYKYGDLITVIAAPGVGKTAYLVNEAVCAAQQGFNVLSVYVGDMTEVTAINRMSACITGNPINAFSNDPRALDNVLKNDPQATMLGVFSRISTIAFPPAAITVNKLITLIDKLQSKHDTHFDVIIVDYADNLVEESDQMYKNGGILYNKLKYLAMTNKSVVFTASQPKIQYFNDEIIPFDGAAESSKKLHVVDFTLTLGKPSRGATIATGFLAKVREGKTGDLFRLKLDLAVSRMIEITDEEYVGIKSSMLEDKLKKDIED